MSTRLKRGVAVFSAAALGLALAACGSGDSNDGNGPGEAKAGGTLTYLQAFPFESTDPMRIYYGVQLANYRRTLYRGLVGFPMSSDPEVANEPVADLATDAGTPTDGGATWAFTLKDGITWEDGSDITCKDFQYGASRVFANDVIIGGPNYTLSYIDVKDYPGPYTATNAQQAAFDKAVSCDGKTITYHFNKPWADFPLAAAALMMVDPYKKSFDQGDRSKWKVLSNGPYKLQGGTWDKNKGATLVRNTEYDPNTDDPDVLRKALPDQINWEINPSDTAGELFVDRMIKDSGPDQNAITNSRVSPPQMPQITGPVKDRYENVLSPFNSYLVPNAKTVTNLKVRQALAAALPLNDYVKALGGKTIATPAETIVNPGVTGAEENPAFSNDDDNNGDIEGAQKLLKESGEKLPYPIKLSYPATPTSNKAMAIIKQGWDDAGFKVELDGLSDTYYDVASTPDKDSDVLWAGWGADWPSIMTILPPLFDSRPNISKSTCGNDYGCYKSDEFNALADKAANASSTDEQIDFMQQADLVLGEQVAYIPLEITKFNWVYGSKIAGFATTPSSSGYPEIGLIGVSD